MNQKREYRTKAVTAMMRDIMHPLPEEPWPEGLPEEVEELLWDYALGLLEFEEEERVITVLGRSRRAEEALSQIRQSMLAAGMALPIEPETVPGESELLGRAWQKVRGVLSVLGQHLESLAAVVVNTGERLIWSQEEPGGGLDLRRSATVRWAAQPVSLDFGTKGESEGPAGGPVEIHGANGLSARVQRISADRVDVLVTVSDPVVEGTIRMFQLVPQERGIEQSELDVGERLREGKATFKDCPAGMLKIVAPDGRELTIFLETGDA